MVLYENEVRTWAQSIVDVTPDYSDGGPSAQGPWSAPASWHRTEIGLVASVKRWLEGGLSAKQGVANPVLEVLRDDHGLTLTFGQLEYWRVSLCAAYRSKRKKRLNVPGGQARLVQMRPAVARNLLGHFQTIRSRIEAAHSSMTMAQLTTRSPNKAALKVAVAELQETNNSLANALEETVRCV